MTKTMMIETIQKKAATLWENLKMTEMFAMYNYPEHGGFEAEQALKNDRRVLGALAQWHIVNTLCEELGIGYEITEASHEYQVDVYRYFYK